MKICLVSDYLPYIHDTWSGAELVSSRLGELLSKRKHCIFYISLNTTKRNIPKNVFCVKTFLSKAPFIGKNFVIDIKSILSIFTILKREKPDVVHILGKYLFLPAAISSLLLRIPYFFTVLDYYIICPRNMLLRPNNELCAYSHGKKCADCFLLSENKLAKKLNKLIPKGLKECLCILRKWAIDYLMNEARRIITFSQTSKERLVKYGYKSDKIEICYHYKFGTINITDDKYDNRHKKILFVGSLTEHKGLDVIIKVMKNITKDIPNAKLLIVGKGKQRYIEYINRLIRENSLQNYIEFLGHKNNEDVLKFIKETDIVVVPEQWYSEFGPVILIEAKLLGKPVVASRIGSIPEYVRDGVDGILATRNRSNEFSDAIIRLLKNKDIRERMSNNISQNIINITKTSDMAVRLERLYMNGCE